MSKLNANVRTKFLISLILTIIFPASIVGIIFGATQSIKWLLVLSIIGVVVGFYVMPIMWIQYAETSSLKSLLYAIENDNIYSVDNLSQQLNKDKNSIINGINILIQKRYLTGYLFVNKEYLELNQNKKQEKTLTRKCPNCGGQINLDTNTCEYCGFKFK